MTNIVYRGSCEGLQEQAFLNHVSKLINNDPRCKNKVYFDLINVGGGDPLEVVKKQWTIISSVKKNSSKIKE